MFAVDAAAEYVGSQVLRREIYEPYHVHWQRDDETVVKQNSLNKQQITVNLTENEIPSINKLPYILQIFMNS